MKLAPIDVQKSVAAHFRITVEQLLSRDRHKSLAFARHVAMWLCRGLIRTGGKPISFPEIGDAFRLDHTTVMSAVVRINGLRGHDEGVRATLVKLETELRALTGAGEEAVASQKNLTLTLVEDDGVEVVTRKVRVAGASLALVDGIDRQFVEFVEQLRRRNPISVETAVAVRDERASVDSETSLAPPRDELESEP